MKTSVYKGIEIKVLFNTVSVYIDGVLHVRFKKDSWLGVQSWLEGEGKYCIEYYFNTRSILTEYDSKDKWLAILLELNKFKF